MSVENKPLAFVLFALIVLFSAPSLVDWWRESGIVNTSATIGVER